MSDDHSDKFTWEPGDVVLPQCTACRHFGGGTAPYCVAFPGGIPWTILRNQEDHRKPWIEPETGEPGDMGVALERSITFEPREDVHPEVLAAILRHLDQLDA